ncbi:ATP-binding cassette domain-containing protein [Kordia sp. YSTF-M3]|uniref:ATP-binding cassette domain-containing protein n=1 Tax=Kordia aestuariivivens TaxID=2759037 RepID=A0ABR7QGF1_9FLAO|nr:ABC transporter transmembrane domain-containing protein [Kordia aestuariivivens]MBC8757655.1 ATP-binding cassette domain-containing protein [Kordia aestuariivivens]
MAEKKSTEKPLKKKKTSSKYNFYTFIKPYRFVFAAGMFFLLLSSITMMLFPYLIGQLLGQDVGNSVESSTAFVNLDDTSTLVTVLFVVFGAQAIFSFFKIYLFGYFTANTLKDIRIKSFTKMITSPLQFFNENKVGELTSRVATDIELLRETFNTTLSTFVGQIITVVISLMILFFMSPKLCLITLAVVPVVALFGMFFGKFIKKVSMETQDSAAKSNAILEESLVGISNVKSFVNEFFEIIKYKKTVLEVRDKTMKIVTWRGIFGTLITFCMFGSIVFVIWQGKLMVESNQISGKHFISFILYTIFVGGSIGSLPDLYAKIQQALGATESLMKILDGTTEKLALQHIKNPLNLKGNVTFENVNFAYDSRLDIEVIKNISLNVKEGQQIALVGPSGSGKSTLSSLLLQFYKPSSGSILFDGKPADQFELSKLRNEMALVPQEVILFGGTIEENIIYGDLNASKEEIIKAAKDANAHDFIMSFPDGYETYVGDRGIQLSGGQKQRIAIARAILKNPSILILDEATSSLDSESELLIQDALDRLMIGRTSFIIAHRLSTIKNCDTILVLKNGQIHETGTHDELINIENGLYKNLSELQYQ